MPLPLALKRAKDEKDIHPDDFGFVSDISCCSAVDVCDTSGTCAEGTEESRKCCFRKGREKMKASRRAITGVGSSWMRRKSKAVI